MVVVYGVTGLKYLEYNSCIRTENMNWIIEQKHWIEQKKTEWTKVKQ